MNEHHLLTDLQRFAERNVEMAKEKAQRIQTAYDLICKYQKLEIVVFTVLDH